MTNSASMLHQNVLTLIRKAEAGAVTADVMPGNL